MSIEHALPGQLNLPIPSQTDVYCYPHGAHETPVRTSPNTYCQLCAAPRYERCNMLETSSNAPTALATRPNKA